MNEDLVARVRDQIVAYLGYGATPVSSLEGFLHGAEKRMVRDVIHAHPDLFELFTRGFPQTGPKDLWVRLKRTDDG